MDILKNIEDENEDREGYRLKIYKVSFKPTVLYSHHFQKLFNDNYSNIVVTNDLTKWKGNHIRNKYDLLNLQVDNVLVVKNKKVNINFQKVDLIDLVINHIPFINRIIFDHVKYKNIKNVDHIWEISDNGKLVKISEEYNLGVPQIYEGNNEYTIIKSDELDISLSIRNKISTEDFNNNRKQCYICDKLYTDMGLILCCNKSSVCINCFKEYTKCPICRKNLSVNKDIIFFKTGIYIGDHNLYNMLKSNINYILKNYKTIYRKYSEEDNKLGDDPYTEKILIYSERVLPYIPTSNSSTVFQLNSIKNTNYNNISHLLIFGNIINSKLERLINICQVEGRTNDLQVIVNGKIIEDG